MKSKNIPPDIRSKTIKDAQTEIKDIIEKLENTQTDLEASQGLYIRMMQLNHHIQDLFKRKADEIKKSVLYRKKKKPGKKSR